MRRQHLILAALLALLWPMLPASAAVSRCEGHYTYAGLSTDTKPTAPQTCDEFRETDTGNEFLWSGSGWVYHARPNFEAGVPKNLTASGQIKATGGVVFGFFVSASSSCTVKLWDNTAASGTVLLSTTAGLTAPLWYSAKYTFANGLYATLAGTCDVTFSYQ